MAFQAASGLFEKRSHDVSDSDIQYYIERFFRDVLYTDTVYCSVSGMGALIRVRLHDPLLVQKALLCEYDLRTQVKRDMNCDIGTIRVMLE